MEGDDDEEDIDDIEHEFNLETQQRNRQQITEAMLHGRMSYGRGPDDENAQIAHNPELPLQIPVLASGQSVLFNVLNIFIFCDEISGECIQFNSRIGKSLVEMHKIAFYKYNICPCCK